MNDTEREISDRLWSAYESVQKLKVDLNLLQALVETRQRHVHPEYLNVFRTHDDEISFGRVQEHLAQVSAALLNYSRNLSYTESILPHEDDRKSADIQKLIDLLYRTLETLAPPFHAEKKQC